MKRLISLVMLSLIVLTSLCISCNPPEKRNDSTDKKEKTVTFNGVTMTLEEYQQMQKKKNGNDPSEYVRQDSGANGKMSQYHTTETIEKDGHVITIEELSELPEDAKPNNKVTVRQLGEENLIIPDKRKDDSDIFESPRLKRPELVVDQKVLESAPPVLQKLFADLKKEITSLRNELEDNNAKLERVTNSIVNKNLKPEEPYEVKRSQVMEEIFSYMRQDMIDRNPYPLEDIPVKYLDFYSVEGCRDDVLKEMEKEIAEIIRRTAKSMRFKQRYIFDDSKNPRRVLRLNYDGNLYNYKKKK